MTSHESHHPDHQVPRLRTWLNDVALPLWTTQGVDAVNGGYFECLDFDGAPVPGGPKRMRVQGRQLYTCSHAAMLGFNQGVLDAAERGFEFLTQHYWHPQGGWRFSVSEEGQPLDDVREAYEQAFALFGFAWYYRATNDQRVLPWLDKTLAFLDTIADKTHGGYRESVPDKLPRRQNPHMHLLEAFLALYETFDDTDYLERAHRLADLAASRFISRDPIALAEYFNDDWTLTSGDAGQILEPGHHFEWTWLLNKYATLSGRNEVRELASGLFSLAEQQGTEQATGLAYDETHRDGSVTNAAKRLWPQTEALKAHLVIDQVDPTTDRANRAHQLVAGMFEHYLLPNGTWQDKLDANNQGIDTSAPASTMYHLFVSFDEYLKRYDSVDYRLT